MCSEFGMLITDVERERVKYNIEYINHIKIHIYNLLNL